MLKHEGTLTIDGRPYGWVLETGVKVLQGVPRPDYRITVPALRISVFGATVEQAMGRLKFVARDH